MTEKKVRLGVIGIGNIGSAHAKTLWEGKIPEATLTAICDISEEKRRFAAENLPGTEIFSSVESLLASKRTDGVIIAVPHPLHAQIALQALEANQHVLVEKPVDISVSKAKKLNEAFAKSDRIFAIMLNQRTDPLFQKAREIVRGGLLGELKRSVWIITNWYRTQGYYDSGDWRATWSGEGGGVLLNQAPHNLDLWQWICGMPVRLRASCECAKYHRIEVEDDATIFARWENGATGIFVTSTGEFPGTNRLEISGSKGKLVLENSTLKWWKLPTDEREFRFDESLKPHSGDVEYEEPPFPPHRGAHALIIRNFCEAILHKAPLISPGEDGIHQLTLSNGAYLSQWKGEEIPIPFDCEEFDRLLGERIAASQPSDSAPSSPQPQGQYAPRWQVNW